MCEWSCEHTFGAQAFAIASERAPSKVRNVTGTSAAARRLHASRLERNTSCNALQYVTYTVIKAHVGHTYIYSRSFWALLVRWHVHV